MLICERTGVPRRVCNQVPQGSGRCVLAVPGVEEYRATLPDLPPLDELLLLARRVSLEITNASAFLNDATLRSPFDASGKTHAAPRE